MDLRLPNSPNPHSVEDIEEGRRMVSEADGWLEEMDRLLGETEVRS